MKYPFIFFLFLSGSLFAQQPDPFKTKEPKSVKTIGSPSPKQGPKDEEIYSPDGTYRKTHGDTIIQGHHINKVFHGEFIEKTSLNTISKTYDHGNLVGYQYTKRTYDNDPTAEKEYWKKGPYFAKSKPSGFFTSSSYDRNFFVNERYMLLLEDTLFFSPNKDIEIHRHASIKGKSNIDMKPGTFVYRIYNTQKPTYSNRDIESALKTKTIASKHFLSNQFTPNGEVIQTNEKGIRVAASYPDYRLTYHPNGTIQDSILKSAVPYQHYHFDANKNLVFKVRNELVPETNEPRKIYTYFRNENPLYSISFVEKRINNIKPEFVSSDNDSINRAIKNGEFRDYYGTVYMTQADGKIDTSFSQETYPYRYQTKLKNGNYYFLPSSGFIGLTRILSVTDSKIEGYTADPRKPQGRTWNHYTVNRIMQNGINYHFSEYYQSYRNSEKIVMQNGIVYSSDWSDRITRQPYEKLKTDGTYTLDQLSNWDNSAYDHNDFALDFAADTLFSFTTQMLTEKEYQKAWNSKPITKMSRNEFDRLVRDLQEIRKREDDALSKVRLNGSKEILIDSRELCQLIYTLGYNPYFTRDEMTQLMTDLKLTTAEQEPLERLMFVYDFER